MGGRIMDGTHRDTVYLTKHSELEAVRFHPESVLLLYCIPQLHSYTIIIKLQTYCINALHQITYKKTICSTSRINPKRSWLFYKAILKLQFVVPLLMPKSNQTIKNKRENSNLRLLCKFNFICNDI